MLQLIDNSGTKPTTDSLLLAEFVKIKPGERVLEVGTGSGVLALLLAQRNKVQILGIDIVPENIEIAQRNIYNNKASLTGEIEFKLRAVQEMRVPQFREQFDVVVSNPPFYEAGEGRLSPRFHRAMARQQITFNLEDLFSTAHYVLRHKGRLFLIYPADSLDKLVECGKNYRLPVKYIQPVYTASHQPAKRVLIMAQKGAVGSVKILPAKNLF